MYKGGFRAGEYLLTVDEKGRQRLVKVPQEGGAVRLKGEDIPADQLLGAHEGQWILTPQGRRYLLLRPTLEELIMNMPRQAQIIYPKDLGMILMWADIAPGQMVVEVGTGHGALTMTLLRALGPEGKLVSFEVRSDHLSRTRRNIAAYLGEEVLERWEGVLGNPAQEGFGQREAERLVVDIPEPWSLLEHATALVVPGGVWLSWLPTVVQVTQLVEALRAHPAWCMVRVFENLQRFWHVRPPSVRPVHEMKAHTGFVVVGRRRWIEEDAQRWPTTR